MTQLLICAVCQRKVPKGRESDHLKANHLGPHTFWFNMREFITMEASMRGAEILQMVGAVPWRWLYEDRGGGQDGAEDICYSATCAVDLTRTPHFYTIPDATMWRHSPLD